MNQLLLALIILSADSSAHTGQLEPDAVDLYRTNFDDSADSNFDGWPDGWTRRRGRGYPNYIAIEIADDQPQGDRKCLRIRMDGGGAQVFAPSIQITPQFSYVLDADVRLDGLKHDIVTIVAAFYDAEEKLLETYETDPVRNADKWVKVRLGPMTPSSDQVRSVVLSTHVRPTEIADLSGTVFIGDFRFARLPKMSVETNNEYNIFSDPRDVTITCRATGFTKDNPLVKFELLDVHAKVLSEHEQRMTGSREKPLVPGPPETNRNVGGFLGSASWKPPITNYGFYSVRVCAAGHSGLSVNFVVAPPMARFKEGEFGWSLPNGDRPLPIKLLPSLLSQVGVHWVKFPVWFDEKESHRAEELAWLAERLSTYDIQLVGVLDQPPQEIKDVFGTKGRLPVASAFDDKGVWHPALDPVMSRLSLKMRWWQLGRDDDTSFASYSNLEGKIREIRDDMTSFGQQVSVGIPWRMLEEPPAEKKPSWSFLSYVDELPMTDAELKSYLATEPASRSDRWIVLQPLSRKAYDLETRIRDLVLRMVAAKIVGSKGVFLPDPFHEDYGVMTSVGTPSEILLPWRTTAAMIGGSRYLGSMKLPNGSENQTFLRDGQAVMVVWNERSVTETLYLGDRVRVYDVWGQPTTPASRTDGEYTEQEIAVGPMPTFVIGVHPEIALWRMNFRFETTRLASVFGREQVVQYRFKNTFSQGVGGRITVHTPSSWTVDGAGKDSAVRQFKVSPQEERLDNFRVVLGSDADTGTQPLRIDFEVTADRNLRFTLFDSLQVGLGDVVVELDTRLDDGGNLIVEQHLVNNTENVVNFNCLLYCPDRRREKRQVFHLNRGRTTNVFILPNGEELIGKTLWLRTEEIGGARIMNDTIVAHE